MDNIRPKHYKLEIKGDTLEVRDIMKSISTDEYRAFCKMNAIKYLLRADKKNGIEDYKKCKFYIDEIISEEKMENEKERDNTRNR